jgi:hypothetical protein
MKILGLAFLALTASITMCCWALEYASPPYWMSEPLEIAGGYGLAPWSEGGYALIGTLSKTGERYAIFSDITTIGWDENFIVVESKVLSRKWYLVDLSTKKTYLCYENSPIQDCSSFEEFQELKGKIGVPGTLLMKDVNVVYKELSEK